MEETEVSGEFRVTNQEYKAAYADTDSEEFKAKALEMEEVVSQGHQHPDHFQRSVNVFFFFQLNDSYKNSDVGDSFISAIVEQITAGSVRIKFKCKFKKKELEE